MQEHDPSKDTNWQRARNPLAICVMVVCFPCTVLALLVYLLVKCLVAFCNPCPD